MYASQYEITLPADYDMDIIRTRVANFGHVLDEREGLGLKAYLVRDRGSGSPVNQYAPFYLWHDTGAMAHFLFGGGGFQNIIRDFGRPTVRHWTGLAAVAGPARDAPPATASRHLEPLDGDVGPAIEALNALRDNDNVHTAALAVDPHHWELVRFVLWRGEPEEGTRYEVRHLSAPGLDLLPSYAVSGPARIR
jgi:hypothetical protein